MPAATAFAPSGKDAIIASLKEADQSGDTTALPLIRQVVAAMQHQRLHWYHFVGDSKVQKLLQLTASTNNNEAVLAYRMARNIMNKRGIIWHQLPDDEAQPRAVQDTWVHPPMDWPKRRRRSRPTMGMILNVCPINIADEDWVRAYLFGVSAADADPIRRQRWKVVVSLLATLYQYSERDCKSGKLVRRWLQVAIREGRLSNKRLLNLSQLCRLAP